ncbi:WD40 repeat-containing protein, putative [Bodo saltans]|uniref:Cilia- and flagella-associated protein 52 n=1 Tax=Bodo saltans TaxID=75058 RepID=A0A0S4JJ02_BODSA|nr:WD40 repeat-containing protein, putative [Bodo saltans]|eukprot:CUG89220.1 WD40 repeat-containing protein, putative [Bodo saltans]
MAADLEHKPRLVLESVVGFGGTVEGGLHIHPDGKHLLYPLGTCIVVREIGNPKATGFLNGHSDKISCLAVSNSGRYVASGQSTHMGFQADICVFDFQERKLVHRMLLHKVKVQALAFSADEQYLASVGGQDDNTLVVWDLTTGRPVCGGPAATDLSLCIRFFNNRSDMLVTGGASTLRVWDIDFQNRKINATDVNMGNIRRQIETIAIEAADRYAYCGTASGDVVCIQLNGPKNYKMIGPTKKFANGILSTTLTSDGDVLIGGGAGDVAVLSKVDLSLIKSVTVQGGVTSVSALGDHFFIGTNMSNVYYLNNKTFKDELRQTCHYQTVNDVVFPHGYSELFATCSANEIRVWNTKTSAELLRIQVGNLECNSIVFTKDGRSIVSGWSDGKVRAFGPQSGKLIYAINDAHKLQGMKRISGSHAGVTAVCVDNSNQRIITGGADSQVRVWRISGQAFTMEASMKEHKATINAISINSSDTECVSASDDGSCIVWDLKRFMRRNIMYAQTYFKSASYFFDESQLLTSGSDRKVTYWDAVDCSAIREIEASKTGEINGLDISADGTFFATGGGDRIVKIWGYDDGTCAAIGLGHSTNISKVKIAPDGKRVVSVSEEGAVMVWRVPELDIQQLV